MGYNIAARERETNNVAANAHFFPKSINTNGREMPASKHIIGKIVNADVRKNFTNTILYRSFSS